MGTDTKQTPPNQPPHHTEKSPQSDQKQPGDQGEPSKQPAGEQPDRDKDASGKSQQR